MKIKKKRYGGFTVTYLVTGFLTMGITFCVPPKEIWFEVTVTATDGRRNTGRGRTYREALEEAEAKLISKGR